MSIWLLVPHQSDFWFAITGGAILGAIAGGAIVRLIQVKASRKAKWQRDNPRHFPPPWSVEEDEGSFVVRDATGQPLSNCRFDNEPALPWSTRRLTKDEARRMAVSIANLPRLLSDILELTASIKVIRDAVEESIGSIALPAGERFEALPAECDAIASLIRASTPNPVIKGLIVGELSKALQRLGADVSLLSIVGSIGNTMNDEDALAMLRDWNAGLPVIHPRQ